MATTPTRPGSKSWGPGRDGSGGLCAALTLGDPLSCYRGLPDVHPVQALVTAHLCRLDSRTLAQSEVSIQRFGFVTVKREVTLCPMWHFPRPLACSAGSPLGIPLFPEKALNSARTRTHDRMPLPPVDFMELYSRASPLDRGHDTLSLLQL